MRHSSLRFATISLFFSIGACTASGSDDQSHGPVFGPNDGGGADVTTTGDGATSPPGDGATPPDDATSDAPPPPPVDGGQDSGQDAGQDSGGCTETTAVLSASSSMLYQSVAVGGGAWTTASVAGTFRGSAALVPFGSGFHGVVVATGNAIQWTAWGGAAWSALMSIGGAATSSAPALATIGGTEIDLVYRGNTDSKYYHGTFKTGAWDSATDPVGGAAAQSFGPTGVGLATIGGALVLSHAGGNNTNLYAEGLAAGTGIPVTGAQTEALLPPILAMNGGANDAMVLYVHLGDFRISWATRAGATWTDHGAIDTTLFTGTGIPVAASALAGGKAVLVYQGSNGKAYASLFDGSTWSVPATNLDPGALGGLPAIAPGACGDDAIIALPMASGAAKTVRLRAGAWQPAADVSGTSGTNVVAIATAN